MSMSRKYSKPPETPDLSMHHWYTYPGDAEGNGMFRVHAPTLSELFTKIEAVHRLREGRDVEAVAEKLKSEHHQRLAGYTVSGEPRT